MVTFTYTTIAGETATVSGRWPPRFTFSGTTADGYLFETSEDFAPAISVETARQQFEARFPGFRVEQVIPWETEYKGEMARRDDKCRNCKPLPVRRKIVKLYLGRPESC